MDDFFSDLESNLTGLGASKVWKRQIGDSIIWLAPITLYGQEKVSEILSNSENLGMKVINETKRITLSFSIVGINDTDLREYRDSIPRFPSVGKDGKTVKVTLDRYLYNKMTSWSAQYVDDLFTVLADLTESEQKANLKNIKFENKQDPEEELKELETKVNDLRKSLGKPKLVELGNSSSEESQYTNSAPEISDDFNPFKTVVRPSSGDSIKITPAIEPDPTPETDQVMEEGEETGSSPEVQDGPVRTVRDRFGNPINAYVSSPSVPNEIIEKSGAAPEVKPINPRFGR